MVSLAELQDKKNREDQIQREQLGKQRKENKNKYLKQDPYFLENKKRLVAQINSLDPNKTGYKEEAEKLKKEILSLSEGHRKSQRTNNDIYELTQEMYTKYNIPVDKFGHFYMNGIPVSSVPNPDFREEDFMLALLLQVNGRLKNAATDKGLDNVKPTGKVSQMQNIAKPNAPERVSSPQP